MPATTGEPFRGMASIRMRNVTDDNGAAWIASIDDIVDPMAIPNNRSLFWDYEQGDTVTLRLEYANPAAISEPDSVTVELRFPGAGTVATWNAPVTQGAHTQTVRLDAAPFNNAADAIRAGLLEIYIKVQRVATVGWGPFDSRGDQTSPPALISAAVSTWARGYLRAKPKLTSFRISNVALGGAEPTIFSYPDPTYSQAVLSADLYSSDPLTLEHRDAVGAIRSAAGPAQLTPTRSFSWTANSGATSRVHNSGSGSGGAYPNGNAGVRAVLPVRTFGIDNYLAWAGDDGIWTWFSDPRAICHQGTARKLYTGYLKHSGAAAIESYDLDTFERKSFELQTFVGRLRDDHNNPALVVLDNGKIAAFYCDHFDTVMRYRVSTNPEDVTAFGAENTSVPSPPTRSGFTYANPIKLTDEGTPNDRVYLFYRSGSGATDASPAVTYSDDNLATWATARVLCSSAGHRPYVVYFSNGVDRIDFLLTDGHPRDKAQTSVFHFYLQGGIFRRTDGTQIGTLAGLATAPLSFTDMTKIHDAAVEGHNAWVWSVALDAQGRPVVTYVTFPGGEQHRYRWARWDGSAWVKKTVVNDAGPDIYISTNTSEPQYSGGIMVDPQNTNRVYLSRGMTPPTASRWEIERYDTADGGDTWTVTAITSGSATGIRNARPVIPRNKLAGCPDVLWWSGSYNTYVAFKTELKASPAFLTLRDYPTGWHIVDERILEHPTRIAVDPRPTFTPHLQLNDPVFDLDKRVTPPVRLRSQQGNIWSRVTNSRGEGVNLPGDTAGGRIELELVDPFNAIRKSLNAATITQDGQAGWSTGNLLFDEPLPSGDWSLVSRVVDAAGNQGSVTTAVTLLGIDMQAMVGATVEGSAHHFEPGRSLTIRLALIKPDDGQRLVPTTADVALLRFTANGQEHFDGVDWVISGEGAVTWLPMTVDPTDARSYRRIFSDTLDWGHYDIFVMARGIVFGSYFPGYAGVEATGSINRHDNYQANFPAFLTG